MTNDWEYLTAARSGDENAARYIYNKYRNSLLKISALITGGEDNAKDIVNETFIRVFGKRIRHTNGNFKSYLTTIAYRLSLKELKRLGKNYRLNEDNYCESSNSILENLSKDEKNKFVLKAILDLPLEQKEILVLRFYGEHSYQEIAEITDIPIGTVKSRIFYAVKACRIKLKQLGVFE